MSDHQDNNHNANQLITMEALQIEILGWLGYLDRWAVSLQITFILCVAVATAFIATDPNQ